MIFILNKVTRITRGNTVDLSYFYPGLIIQMLFSFFNVESIRGFTYTFVAICYSDSYYFVFTSRVNITPMGKLLFLLIHWN